jgi:hypothetical protein
VLPFNQQADFAAALGQRDILSTVVALAKQAPSLTVALGAVRAATAASPLQGWTWVDGSNASNLMCGQPGYAQRPGIAAYRFLHRITSHMMSRDVAAPRHAAVSRFLGFGCLTVL